MKSNVRACGAAAAAALAMVVLGAGCGSPSGSPAAESSDSIQSGGAAPRAPSGAALVDPSRGQGLALGIVSGRIYDDLAAHAAERMRDLGALGVRILRIEIERTTPWSTYETLAEAAFESGIDVLPLVSMNSVPGAPNPMDGSLASFDATYVPAYVATVDETMAHLPHARFVEVWNEPNGFGFFPMADSFLGRCIPRAGATRYALLATRVFETMSERRAHGIATPQVVAFGISRQDDVCVRSALFESEPVRNHRRYYRAPRHMPDGLPTDIVDIHAYGNTPTPNVPGYTNQGGKFADGVNDFLSLRFADNGHRVIGESPVWYTEFGYGLQQLHGPDPGRAQADALAYVANELRKHPEVTAAFWYDYRDDEAVAGSEGNRMGVRGDSRSGFAAHPSYVAYQAEAVASGDHVAPVGEVTAFADGVTVAPGARLDVAGWSIDADGSAPSIAIAVDGAEAARTVDGAAPNPAACAAAFSARCPNVGFASSFSAPAAPGTHAVTVIARDAAGNGRTLATASIVVSGS